MNYSSQEVIINPFSYQTMNKALHLAPD